MKKALLIGALLLGGCNSSVPDCGDVTKSLSEIIYGTQQWGAWQAIQEVLHFTVYNSEFSSFITDDHRFGNKKHCKASWVVHQMRTDGVKNDTKPIQFEYTIEVTDDGKRFIVTIKGLEMPPIHSAG